MDEESKAIAASIPGVIHPDGARRPFSRLNTILARLWTEREERPIKQLFFLFDERTLEVSADDEFFSVDRIHLRKLERPSSDEIASCIDLSKSTDFAHLIGLDLESLRWELRAGDIDQFIVLEFKAHKQYGGVPDAEITIKGDDFHLLLFKGAPSFPNLVFDTDTQVCRPM